MLNFLLMTTKSQKRSRPSYFKCPQCLGYFKLEKKKAHVCVEPSEANLVRILNEDCVEVWYDLRKFATDLGDQRVYASAKAIMFSRRICYFFVRPKPKEIELCLFLNRRLKDSTIHRVQAYSKSKFAHTIKLRHVDQIGVPLTDWLREAWDLAG
jgi:hypothetical protein